MQLGLFTNSTTFFQRTIKQQQQQQQKNIGTQSVQELFFVIAFVELFTVMI